MRTTIIKVNGYYYEAYVEPGYIDAFPIDVDAPELSHTDTIINATHEAVHDEAMYDIGEARALGYDKYGI